MADGSCFDIIGPIMVGPSSSHTAGAARLGLMARAIFNEKPEKVQILLHGSFFKTYMGHGTFQALVAGILGYEVHDERISKSLQDAEKLGINILGPDEINLGDEYHENSVKFVLTTSSAKTRIIGSSVGGGNIKITDIDDYGGLEITGEHETLFAVHIDRVGIVHDICGIIREDEINIHTAYTKTTSVGEGYTLMFVNKPIREDILNNVRGINGIKRVLAIRPLSK